MDLIAPPTDEPHDPAVLAILRQMHLANIALSQSVAGLINGSREAAIEKYDEAIAHMREATERLVKASKD